MRASGPDERLLQRDDLRRVRRDQPPGRRRRSCAADRSGRSARRRAPPPVADGPEAPVACVDDSVSACRRSGVDAEDFHVEHVRRGHGRSCGRARGSVTALDATPSARARPQRPRRRRRAGRRAGGGSNVPLRTGRGHLLVRVAKRNTVARRAPRPRPSRGAADPRGGREPVAVELEPARRARCERSERAGDVATGREHGRLVLLQVAVVGERQALHRREQARQPPDRRSGLAAGQLGDVGVQLLRHHRRPGRRVLGEPGEPELRRRPEDDLLADPREVHEQHGDGVEVVEREVAVRDGVERVPHRVRRRRQRRASSPRARPRRAATEPPAPRRSEPPAVALQHLDPREQVVAERDRLRALEVRVAGHRRRRLLLGPVEHARRNRRAPRRPRRKRPRRRAGARWRPGRCASAPHGSSGPPRRAAARSPCACPRRTGRPRRSTRAVHYLREFLVVEEPGRVRRSAWIRVASMSYGRSSASSARRNSHTSGARPSPTRPAPERHSGQPSAARASAACRRCRSPARRAGRSGRRR